MWQRLSVLIVLLFSFVCLAAFDWADWYNGHPWSMNVWEDLQVTDIGTQHILIHRWEDLHIGEYQSVRFEYKKPGFWDPWVYMYDVPSAASGFWHKWQFPANGSYYVRLAYYDRDCPEGITLAIQRVRFKKAYRDLFGRVFDPWKE